MKITEVSYTRKVNLGNYESADLSMTAVLAEGDDALREVVLLKDMIEAGLGLKDKIDFTQVEEIDGENVTMKDGSKIPVTEKTEFKNLEEEVVEEPKKVAKKAKKKAKKKAVKKVAKNVVYDRENDQHKSELAKILNEHVPSWKEDKGVKAKSVSEQMSGVDDIFDGSGKLLESFINSVVEGMDA